MKNTKALSKIVATLICLTMLLASVAFAMTNWASSTTESEVAFTPFVLPDNGLGDLEPITEHVRANFIIADNDKVVITTNELSIVLGEYNFYNFGDSIIADLGESMGQDNIVLVQLLENFDNNFDTGSYDLQGKDVLEVQYFCQETEALLIVYGEAPQSFVQDIFDEVMCDPISAVEARLVESMSAQVDIERMNITSRNSLVELDYIRIRGVNPEEGMSNSRWDKRVFPTDRHGNEVRDSDGIRGFDIRNFYRDRWYRPQGYTDARIFTQVQGENFITSIIPRELFFTLGEWFFAGEFFGFYVITTSRGGNSFRSEVILLDISTRSNWQNTYVYIEVEPIFQGVFQATLASGSLNNLVWFDARERGADNLRVGNVSMDLLAINENYRNPFDTGYRAFEAMYDQNDIRATRNIIDRGVFITSTNIFYKGVQQTSANASITGRDLLLKGGKYALGFVPGVGKAASAVIGAVTIAQQLTPRIGVINNQESPHFNTDFGGTVEVQQARHRQLIKGARLYLNPVREYRGQYIPESSNPMLLSAQQIGNNRNAFADNHIRGQFLFGRTDDDIRTTFQSTVEFSIKRDNTDFRFFGLFNWEARGHVNTIATGTSVYTEMHGAASRVKNIDLDTGMQTEVYVLSGGEDLIRLAPPRSGDYLLRVQDTQFPVDIYRVVHTGNPNDFVMVSGRRLGGHIRGENISVNGRGGMVREVNYPTLFLVSFRESWNFGVFRLEALQVEEFRDDGAFEIGVGETRRFYINTTDGQILDTFEFFRELTNGTRYNLDQHFSYRLYDEMNRQVARTRGMFYLRPNSRYWFEVTLNSNKYSPNFRINIIPPPNIPDILFGGSENVLFNEWYNHFVFEPKLRAVYTFGVAGTDTRVLILDRNLNTVIHARDSVNHFANAGSKYFIIVYSIGAGQLEVKHNVEALRLNDNQQLFFQEQRYGYMTFSAPLSGDYVFYSRQYTFVIIGENGEVISPIALDDNKVVFRGLKAGVTYRIRVSVRQGVINNSFGTVRVTFGDVDVIASNVILDNASGFYMINTPGQFEILSGGDFVVYDEFLRVISTAGARRFEFALFSGERVFVRIESGVPFVVLSGLDLNIGQNTVPAQAHGFSTNGYLTYVVLGASISIFTAELEHYGDFRIGEFVNLSAGRYIIISSGIASLSILEISIVTEGGEFWVGDEIELTASHPNAVFEIVNGREFAEIIDGRLVINSFVPIHNATVTVRAVLDRAVSDSILFNILVPITEIVLSASNMTPNPGQNVTLSYSVNSNATDPNIRFAIVSGGEYATLSGNVLTIGTNVNSFGRQVVIEAYTYNGSERFVSERLTLDIRLRPQNISIDTATEVFVPGAVVDFNAALFDDMGMQIIGADLRLRVLSGQEFVKSLNSNNLSLNICNSITVLSPQITVEVYTSYDGMEITSPDFVLDIYIALTSISLSGVTSVDQDMTYTFIVNFEPSNATRRNVEFFLGTALCAQFATITADGRLTLINNVHFVHGQTVVVSARSMIYSGIEAQSVVTINYIRTESISISGANAISGLAIPDQTLTVVAAFEPFNASNQSISLELLSNTHLASVSDNTITISDFSYMNSNNPSFRVRAIYTRVDGTRVYSAERTIIIHVPVSTVSVANITMSRGLNSVDPVFNTHGFASNRGFTLEIVSNNADHPIQLRNNNTQVYIPNMAHTGTIYQLRARSVENPNIVSNIFNITVHRLSTSNMAIYIGGHFINLTLGSNSLTWVNINDFTNPQLMAGATVDLAVRYRPTPTSAWMCITTWGENPAFGINVSSNIASIDGATRSLSINSNASGNNNSFRLSAQVDGVAIPSRTISVFRRVVSPTLANTIIRSANTTLSHTALSSLYTPGLSTMQYSRFSGSGFSINENTLSVTANGNPRVSMTAYQWYNGHRVHFRRDNIAMTFEMITLHRNDGGGGTNSVARALGATVGRPNHSSMAFLGYYCRDGQRFYNYRGTRQIPLEHLSGNDLFARWIARSHTVSLGTYNSGSSLSSGSSSSWNRIGGSGATFGFGSLELDRLINMGYRHFFIAIRYDSVVTNTVFYRFGAQFGRDRYEMWFRTATNSTSWYNQVRHRFEWFNFNNQTNFILQINHHRVSGQSNSRIILNNVRVTVELSRQTI